MEFAGHGKEYFHEICVVLFYVTKPCCFYVFSVCTLVILSLWSLSLWNRRPSTSMFGVLVWWSMQRKVLLANLKLAVNHDCFSLQVKSLSQDMVADFVIQDFWSCGCYCWCCWWCSCCCYFYCYCGCYCCGSLGNRCALWTTTISLLGLLWYVATCAKAMLMKNRLWSWTQRKFGAGALVPNGQPMLLIITNSEKKTKYKSVI